MQEVGLQWPGVGNWTLAEGDDYTQESSCPVQDAIAERKTSSLGGGG